MTIEEKTTTTYSAAGVNFDGLTNHTDGSE